MIREIPSLCVFLSGGPFDGGEELAEMEYFVRDDGKEDWRLPKLLAFCRVKELGSLVDVYRLRELTTFDFVKTMTGPQFSIYKTEFELEAMSNV